MDLKSKQCPVGEFSTSYSCCLLPSSPALYYPKETSSQSVISSLEGRRKAVPVVARVRERGWRCRKNPKALRVNLGYCGLQTPSLHGSRRGGHVLNQGGQPLGNEADTWSPRGPGNWD